MVHNVGVVFRSDITLRHAAGIRVSFTAVMLYRYLGLLDILSEANNEVLDKILTNPSADNQNETLFDQFSRA